MSRIVPHGWLRWFASALAWMGFLFLPSKRATIRRNLRVVLTGSPEPAAIGVERRIRALARREMAGYGQVMLDLVTLPEIAGKVHADTKDTAGWHHLDRALDAGRGVVFATAHLGSWDAAGAAVAGHCAPGTVFAVAEPFSDPRLEALVTGERAQYGLGVVPMTDVRRMVRTLRDGKILGVLIDRPVTSGDGVTVSLFGRDTMLPAGAAALATLASTVIVPGFLLRRPDGGFEGEILPPIEPIRAGNRQADLAATMQLVVQSLEPAIRRTPHQWYMFRDMWPPAPESLRPRGFGARPRLRRIVLPAIQFGSILAAAWYVRRLPIVRTAWRVLA
ncbi:MAG: lysophospholipid acyltransferase family protein [Chloroflexota bacterium]